MTEADMQFVATSPTSALDNEMDAIMAGIKRARKMIFEAVIAKNVDDASFWMDSLEFWAVSKYIEEDYIRSKKNV